MELTPERTVADYVTENIKASHIFKKYGIDFCCGGGISLEKACADKGVEYSQLLEELQNLDLTERKGVSFNDLPINELIDYIVEKHHKYVEANIGLLIQYSSKVAKVHGANSPELIEVNKLFQKVAGELASHLKKEELILFPFIKKMLIAEREGTPINIPHFNTVENPIKMMEDEHEEAGNIFKEIARITNNYTPPAHACNTYRALFDKLDEFEQDLHQHIHLENNILHPKALKLEKKLRS
ncbi:iron-sulfur cluster repair di-iron protein [Christiangramia sediminis]|uniref:Iron-sulfur cluster repair di-iron protein n=1 Tax=Christiangramia sediminis TaxID=2881336 RepID=A0A9X1LKY6_9FLAO|nr:iron-sulfur cluster repair di-iron protein [Christiangramia sediminis]MCB7482097.1 iron-sulfur cluster repair di-iron protein [Christiangramia sediminis]